MIKKAIGLVSIIAVIYLVILFISIASGAPIGFIDATVMVLTVCGICGFALLFAAFMEWCFTDD